jgi:hypothetical protein
VSKEIKENAERTNETKDCPYQDGRQDEKRIARKSCGVSVEFTRKGWLPDWMVAVQCHKLERHRLTQLPTQSSLAFKLGGKSIGSDHVAIRSCTDHQREEETRSRPTPMQSNIILEER